MILLYQSDLSLIKSTPQTVKQVNSSPRIYENHNSGYGEILATTFTKLLAFKMARILRCLELVSLASQAEKYWGLELWFLCRGECQTCFEEWILLLPKSLRVWSRTVAIAFIQTLYKSSRRSFLLFKDRCFYAGRKRGQYTSAILIICQTTSIFSYFNSFQPITPLFYTCPSVLFKQNHRDTQPPPPLEPWLCERIEMYECYSSSQGENPHSVLS